MLGGRAVARWVSLLMVLAASAAAAPGSVFTFEPAVSPAPGCASLRPEAPAPSVVDTSQYGGRGRLCASGISNGEGYVALRTDDSFGYPAQEKTWDVKPLWGGAGAGSFTVGENTFGTWRVTMFPEDQGWLTSQAASEYENTQVRGWSSTGTPVSGLTMSAWPSVVVPDFTSGAVVAYESSSDSFRLKVRSFNADGSPRSEAVDVAGAASGLVIAGVDDHRDVLVLFDGGTVGLPSTHIAGRWLDPCGVPLTAVFDTGLPFPMGGELVPLTDGSLVFQSGGQWVARFPHLSTAPAGPAPEWLVARPGMRLVWVDRGKGYALIPFEGDDQAPCRSQLFLFTKAGGFCGTATFTVDARSCVPPEINVGPDGTVVQRSPRPGECTDPSCWYHFCTYTWWPGLLGGHGPEKQSGDGQRPPFGTRPVHCGQSPGTSSGRTSAASPAPGAIGRGTAKARR